jgi:malate dehydrogenase
VIYDKKKILAVCALLEGEYGVKGYFVGVPVVLGKGGVEKIITVKMDAEEKALFKKSVAAVTKTCAEVDRLSAPKKKTAKK